MGVDVVERTATESPMWERAVTWMESHPVTGCYVAVAVVAGFVLAMLIAAVQSVL